jgi:hypothetical protein
MSKRHDGLEWRHFSETIAQGKRGKPKPKRDSEVSQGKLRKERAKIRSLKRYN